MEARIGKVCANPPGKDKGQNKDEEFVQVIVGTSGDISDYVLQHLANPKGSNTHPANIYVFPTNSKFGSSTSVVVHNGGGRNGYDSSGNYHVYTAGLHGKGNWKLNNDGDTVTLLNAQEQEVSRRVLQGSECEAITTPIVITPTSPTRAYGN